VRHLIVASLLAAVAAAAAPAANAARVPYANFKVSFSGTQTTQVTGSEDCSDAGGGTSVPANASETATFSSVKPRTLQFERSGRELNISPAKGYGESTMAVKATIDRESQFARDAGASPVCPGGGQPNSSCGHAILTAVLLVQGGHNQVSFVVEDFHGFEPGLCLVPKAFGFPDVLPPKDYENHSTIKYSAKAPASLLNPHKKLVIVHGSATATNSGQDADMHVTSAVSTLKFTMRLRRAPLR
jgi:hypothetical protein